MKKFLAVVLVLVIVLVVFLQFFLGKTIKTVVEKNAQEFLTAKLEMKDLKFNILGGSVDLRGLKVHNPPGFQEEYLYILERSFEDLGLLSLLRKQIVIEDVTIQNSDLVVVRNKQGKFNFKELIKTQEKKEGVKEEKKKPKEEAAAPPKKADKGKIELPALLLKDMNITSVLTYVDYKISKKPFNLGFETEIAGKNLATFGPKNRLGTLTVKGHLKGNKAEFITDLRLEVPPLTDLENPTFNLSLEVQSVNMKRLAAYKHKTGIEEGRLSLSSNIVCVNGEIKRQESIQAISVKGLKVTDDIKNKKLKGQKPPTAIEFSFHLFGRIENPQHDFWKSFFKALLNPTSVIKSQLSDKLGAKTGATGGIGGIGILGGAKQDKTKEGEKEEKSSPLGGMLPGLGAKAKEDEPAETKKETTAPTEEAKPKEKSSPLGGMLPGLGAKAKEDEPAETKKETEKSSPFSAAKKLF